MKRLTESQIRQVIREEITGLLNEIKLDGNFFGLGSKNKIDILFEMKGLELIEKLKIIDESKLPPELLNFLKIYNATINQIFNAEKAFKKTKNEKLKESIETLTELIEEINKTVVLRFSYNHAKLFNRGYKIELFSLSDAKIKAGEEGKKLAAFEFGQMRKVSLERDRKDVKRYEQLLGITVPNPVGGVVDVIRPTQAKNADGKSEIGSFKDQLDAELRGEPYGGLDKGVRENKKRSR